MKTETKEVFVGLAVVILVGVIHGVLIWNFEGDAKRKQEQNTMRRAACEQSLCPADQYASFRYDECICIGRFAPRSVKGVQR